MGSVVWIRFNFIAYVFPSAMFQMVDRQKDRIVLRATSAIYQATFYCAYWPMLWTKTCTVTNMILNSTIQYSLAWFGHAVRGKVRSAKMSQRLTLIDVVRDTCVRKMVFHFTRNVHWWAGWWVGVWRREKNLWIKLICCCVNCHSA